MAALKQQTLRTDLASIIKRLPALKTQFGEHSVSYQQALIRVKRLWSILRMTRSQTEFLQDIKN